MCKLKDAKIADAYEARVQAALTCIKDCHNTFKNRYHITDGKGQDLVALDTSEVEEKLRALLAGLESPATPVSPQTPETV